MIIRIALFSACLILASAVAGQAQTPVTSFEQLPEVLKTGTRVFVTDEKGQVTKGKVTELSATSLALLTSGMDERQIVFPSERVRRVSRIDSRLNGFLIGAAAGLVPGIWLGLSMKTWCENELGNNCAALVPYLGGLAGLGGGVVGFAVDSAINGRTLVLSR